MNSREKKTWKQTEHYNSEKVENTLILDFFLYLYLALNSSLNKVRMYQLFAKYYLFKIYAY